MDIYIYRKNEGIKFPSFFTQTAPHNIWVVGVSERGEGWHSDRLSGVTYDSEWDGINVIFILLISYVN